MKLNEKDRRKLEAEAQRLVETGQMPSLEAFLAAVEKVRDEYRPLILAARRNPNADVEN